jgi:hypothetical protein
MPMAIDMLELAVATAAGAGTRTSTTLMTA